MNKFVIIRSTTPTLYFTLPFDTSICSKIIVMFGQNRKALFNRDETSLVLDGPQIKCILTQEETASFMMNAYKDEGYGECQIKCYTSTGFAPASLKCQFIVKDIIDDSIIGAVVPEGEDPTIWDYTRQYVQLDFTIGDNISGYAQKGEWNAEATYTAGNVVTYRSSSYVCKKLCVGIDPYNTEYWQYVALGFHYCGRWSEDDVYYSNDIVFNAGNLYISLIMNNMEPLTNTEAWGVYIEGGGVSDYPDLNEKPTLNGVTIVGDQVSADLGLKDAAWMPTKAEIGLGNVDNTSDLNKPVSVAQQAAITAVAEAIPEVVDNVTTVSDEAALSAKQGKLLNDRINNLASIGRYLAVWDCTTGLPLSDPGELPYYYRAGDFYNIGATGEINYMPVGNAYTGEPSTTIIEETVNTDDFFFYDGAAWLHLVNKGGGKIVDVQVDGTSVVSGGVAAIDLTGKASTESVTALDTRVSVAEGDISEISTALASKLNGVTDAVGTVFEIDENGRAIVPKLTGSSWGLARPNTVYGTKEIGGGYMGIVGADNSEITSRGTGTHALLPKHTNLIVKSALTDANRISDLTDEEKANARAVFGALGQMLIKLAGTAQTPDAEGYVDIKLGDGMLLDANGKLAANTNSNFGTGADGSGLNLVKATYSEINDAAHNYKPIVPSSQGLAVKRALGVTVTSSTSNTEWTDAEKETVRNTIGAVTQVLVSDNL